MRHLPAQSSQLCFTYLIQPLQELTQPQLLSHGRLQPVILRTLWVAFLHALADVLFTLPGLRCPQPRVMTPLPPGSTPFLSTPALDIFLIPGDRPQDEMDSLVRLGVLSSYRYVDAHPQPAFIGLRARS